MGIDGESGISSVEFNRALDFCVWVLQKDGLRVPPFDRHPDGDASLRGLGLDSRQWQSWVEDVASGLERRAISQRLLDGHISRSLEQWHRQIEDDGDPEQRHTVSGLRIGSKALLSLGKIMIMATKASVVPSPQPVSVWPGTEGARLYLKTMFDTYRTQRGAPRRRYWKSPRLRDYLISSRFQVLQSEIEALGRLVCFVNYPGPVVYRVSESTVVIGVTDWDVDGAEFERIVDEALYRSFGLVRK